MQIPTHYKALSQYLADHEEAEGHALAGYADVLEDRPDDLATYLVTMILNDEVRHHQMFADMRETLESRMDWREPESQVPTLNVAGDLEALLAATERLLEFEKADAKELRKLSRSWRRSRGERKMWALLVDTARLDTEKHIRILNFLKTTLKEAQHQAGPAASAD